MLINTFVAKVARRSWQRLENEFGAVYEGSWSSTVLGPLNGDQSDEEKKKSNRNQRRKKARELAAENDKKKTR